MQKSVSKIVNYKISDIIGAEYNPRQLTEIEYEHLKNSLKRFGFVDPLIINTHKDRKNILIGGHQRLRVAKDLKYKEIPCVEVSLEYDMERELNIRLNKNNGSWDWDALANYFDVEDLSEWGFTEEELQFDLTPENEGLTDEDDVPEVEESIANPGDLWILCEHKLLCGDATKKEDVERLMGGDKSDLLLTDPPYNLGFEYNSYDDKKSTNEYSDFICNSIINFKCENKIITTGKQNLWLWYKHSKITDVGIWYSKNKMSGGKISNLSLWEPIVFIGKYDRSTRPNDIFEFTNENQKDTGDHTCPKTVKLFGELLNYGGTVIYDPFLGSGTTLIACEKTNRKCYGMEIDPHYCDVIIKRWEDYTGKKAELSNDH